MTRLRLLLTALLFFCLPACKPGAEIHAKTEVPAPKKIIYLAARGNESVEKHQIHLFTQMLAGNPAVTLEVLDAGGDSRKQTTQFLTAVAAHPFAILVRPVDAGFAGNKITNSGVLVIGLGAQAADSGCSTVLSYDETELGRQAGMIVVEILTRKAKQAGQAEVNGRLVEIRGDEVSTAATKRHEGLTEALKAAPGIILVHDAPGEWTKEGGSGRMQDAIRLQQSFDVVYAQNDVMALGAAQAAGTQRKDVFIIGTGAQDGLSGGLAMIVRGEINATVYQPPLVDYALELIRKKLAEPTFQPKPGYELKPRAVLPEDVSVGIRGGGTPFPAF